MAEYIIQEETLSNIADAIREQTEIEEELAVSEYANLIRGIVGGSGNVQTITVTGSPDDIKNTLSEVTPKAGEIYLIQYYHVNAPDNHVEPERDENGNPIYPIVVTDTVRYRVKIGDGVTNLADLPFITPNLQAGKGNGSIVQIDPTYDDATDCWCSPSEANATLSAAFGTYNKVNAKSAAAFGYSNEITENGKRSFVCNMHNTANAERSFIAGYENTSNGIGSIILGGYNETKARGQMLFGRYLNSNTASQIILGNNNAQDENASLIIGNGASDEERNNALAIKNDGSIELLNVPFTEEKLKILANSSAGYLKVSAPQDVTVYVSNGDIALEAISNGELIEFYNVPYGNWTISATLADGITYERKVKVGNQDIPILYFDTPSESFSESSLESIIMACECNQVPDSWNIGDKKEIQYNGKALEIAIIGKNFDTFSNGKIAPLTLQFVSFIRNMTMDKDHSREDDWEHSQVREMINSQIVNFPEILQHSLASITKETILRDGTTQITEDILFIPSHEEINGEEATSYPYYTDDTSRIKYSSSAVATRWYTRTPHQSNNYYVCVEASGVIRHRAEDASLGLSPAFCIGPTYADGDNNFITEICVTKEEFEQFKTDLNIQNYEEDPEQLAVKQANYAFHATSANYASSATIASKAQNDGEGRDIVETYATKAELQNNIPKISSGTTAPSYLAAGEIFFVYEA